MKVEWSREANETFIHIVTEINERWTAREVEKFIDRVNQVVQFIEKSPEMYPFSDSGKVHRAVISKQTNLYYHIVTDSSKVILLSFEDNRQNPGKLNY
jgi:plasmid stabilization system protein ParE